MLDETEAENVPLLERLKFHAIVGSNLDEFFMVRVAGLKQQPTGEVGELPADGLSAHEQLVKISIRAHDLMAQQMVSLMGNLIPRLALDGTFVLVKPEQLRPTRSRTSTSAFTTRSSRSSRRSRSIPATRSRTFATRA